ncbi:cobyrinic acid a,c-diamide synthase [Halorubrum gandharaense]
MKAVVLGGTSSGVGKTVAAVVVARALADAGYEPVPAKAGPDYIDPSHHAAALDRPSRTLDTWMQGVDGVRRNIHRAADDEISGRGRERVAVVEGMMGLYDGTATSTAATAAALDAPVVLVVDASAGMESVGATALGFREYAAHADLPDEVTDTVTDPRVEVAGVVPSRAHGGRHADGIREALPDGIAWCGRIPPMDDLDIPDRHLGLHMGEEAPLPEDPVAEAAEAVEAETIAGLAREVPAPGTTRTEAPARDPRPTVAVASDDAFRFVYPATRDRLRELADVVTFAPVAGDGLPPEADAVYLPGGYPENHAAALANSPALETLGERTADGLPVLGECGGLMALSESLTTVDGETHEMAGVLPGGVEMHERYQGLDHVELRARRGASAPRVSAEPGETQRGHEFHYSSHALGRGAGDDEAAVDAAPDARFAFDVVRGEGIDGDRDGLTEHRTVGTYAHRHAESGAFDRLVAAAADYATGS